jgi:hypothetical protein
MSSKPTLLMEVPDINLGADHLKWFLEPMFNIELLDVNRTYDPRSTVVMIGADEWNSSNGISANVQKIRDTGIRCVIDRCWDCWDSSLDNSADFTLRPRDFIRINESAYYRYLNYNNFDLISNPTCDFLLLMNGIRPYRTKLYNALEPVLEGNIYSYVEYGVPLQNAKDQEANSASADWQRYTDPTWYTSTRFSIVSESKVYKNTNPADDINVTEKTLKTCAFKHPVIVWGQAGALAWHKHQGFETFDHCVDETYDTIEDDDIRLEKVVEQINLCIKDKTIFTDPVTQQKIEHNYNHFYRKDIVIKLLHEQIVNPLMRFIES